MDWITRTQDSIGLLILRLTVGAMFAFHGYEKLFGDLTRLTEGIRGMGFPFPEQQAYLVAGSEFFGGLLLIFGLFTRMASIPLLVIMLVAIWKVHGPKGFSLQGGGFEYNLVISGALFALLCLGSGKFSLDRKISQS